MKRHDLKAVIVRLVMMITAFVFTFDTLPLSLIPQAKPITAIADYSASTSGNSSFSSSVLDYEKKLTDNGDGTFTFKMDVGASYALDDLNVNCDISRNGYYIVKTHGDYLIQLWGGDGGNGRDKTLFKDGGEGGEGGYVYGTVSLDAGDVIYYALGGDGLTETRSEDGGGVNGDGGGHGDSGSFKVGGGGGYSAVYLFENDSDSAFDEDTRKANVIMIAGGGGGGGGAANLLSADILSNRTPDGGDGGNIETSASGTISHKFDDGTELNGTFYAGGNGKSSGKSTKYVGIGGSDIPGLIPDTVLGWFEGSPSNDWFCEYHPDYEGGAGGSGNLRGGAGGAGFCGGSGGVMKSLIEAANIGGGGGGSSFIADIVGEFDKNLYKDFYQTTNNSTTGGALALKRLPDESENYDYLNNISISGEISQYFDIVESISSNVTTEGQKFTAIGSVKPNSEGKKGDILTVELLLKPKAGFHGGNNIPLFEGDFNCKSTTAEKETTIPLEDDTSNVNIPLTITLYPVSKTVAIGEEYSYSSLHNYGESCGAEWTYKDFIDTENGNFYYTMKDTTGTDYAFNDNSTSHAEKGTHTYVIECKLTPNGNVPAKVGTEAVARTFTATSYVEVIEPDPFSIAGYNVQMWKTLWHDGEYYNLKTNFKADSPTETVTFPYWENIAALDQKNDSTRTSAYVEKRVQTGSFLGIPTYTNYWVYDYTTDNSISSSFKAPVSGYYYIQAWGADGGNGGSKGNTSGKIGGNGGYVSGYVYLLENEELDLSIGAKGAGGNSNSTDADKRTGGTGGGGTIVKSGETILIAAGGGAGGDAVSRNNDQVALDGAPAGIELNPSVPTPEECNGGLGRAPFMDVEDSNEVSNTIHNSNIYTDTYKPKAGLNYMNRDLVSDDVPEEVNAFEPDETNPANTGGAVRITLLANGNQDEINASVESEKLALQKGFEQFVITEYYSQYFDVEKAETSGIDCTYKAEIADDKVIFSNIAASKMTVSQSETVNTYDKTYAISAEAEYSVTVKLKPKGGFLGGNDVPFLEELILQHGEESYSDRGADSKIVCYADTVNVAIDSSGLSIKPLNPEVICGEPLTLDKLCEYTQPTDLDDWQGEFVDFVNPTITPEFSAINNTTTYDITIGLAPTITNPTATVIAPVSAVNQTVKSTAFVEYQINYELENMRALTETAEFQKGGYDIFKKEEADSYVVTLIPLDGYLMPETVTVTGADNGWTFNSTTGELTIPKASINNNITITAEGVKQAFKVKYYYEYYIKDIDTVITKEYTDEKPYYPGDTVNNLVADGTFPDDSVIPEYPGYEYAWDWGIYDEHGNLPNPIIMESSDLWVIGNYVPKEYTLTIEYGSPVNKTVTEKVRFGQTYAVESPDVTGYLADTAVVTGTMPADDVEITVNYTPTENQLNIVHIYKDVEGNIIDTTKDEPKHFATGETYSESITPPAGYEASKNTISGTMTADGIIEYVYYTPKTITITFEANGGNCATNSIDVRYNEIYGYNTMYGKFEYNGLPVAYSTGKTFLGWQDESGQLVTEETIVTNPENHVFIAQWEEDPVYSVTVNYYYANNIENSEKAGTEAATSQTIGDKKQNMSYSIESPDITGYVPNISVVEGTIGSEDVVVNVYYSDAPQEGEDDLEIPIVPTATINLQLKVYDIMFKNSDGGLVDSSAPTLSGGKYRLQTLKDGVWEDVPNSERTNTTGTIEWNNIDTKLSEGGQYRVVSDLAPYGYKFIDPENTVKTLESGDNTIIAFLNYSEELPFAGGVSDVWLYTLGITFLFTAVGLWFVDSKNKVKKSQN